MTLPGSGSHGERLARLEAQWDQLVLMTARAQSDQREELTWRRRLHERQAVRLAALERDVERMRTHLNWMKAIGLAVQAAVLGWLGWK